MKRMSPEKIDNTLFNEGEGMDKVSDEKLEPNCWTCIYCGTHIFNPELELAKAGCKCGTGQGRWKVDRIEEAVWTSKS
jgi:hypothetical protein